jgi:hypothetical protein
MENAPNTKTSTTQSRNENLTCWQTATSPQCLRVETTSEVHLFPYGYFCRAKFSREGNSDTIEIQFQETVVIAKGKGLEPLCDALARLGVERIKITPAKYAAAAKEGYVSQIEIKKANTANQV